MRFLEEKVLKQIIIKIKQEGKTLEEISEEFGIPIRNIKYDLLEHGGKEGRLILFEELERKMPIQEIVENYVSGEFVNDLENQYNISSTEISEGIREYQLLTGQKISRGSIQNQNNKIQEQINKPRISISMIVGYLRLGMDMDRIREFAEQNNYFISAENIEKGEKIQSGELKVASKESISKIIQKYGYSYKELVEVAKHNGYIILKETYDLARTEMNNNRKGEELEW